VTTAVEFLAGVPEADGSWTFAVGRERHGAFGGAFGGVVSACCVAAARSLAPDRAPASLDVNYVRGLPAGRARVVPKVVHAGRSLTTASVDVLDETGRLCTLATVKLVAADALEPLDHPGAAVGTAPVASPYDEGVPWRNPPGREVPLIDTFAPRAVGRDDGAGIATALRVPWDEPGGAAEAACLAADICVGPPVAGAFDRWVPHPNPDLSLRFASASVGDDVVGWGRLERVEAGLATVRVEVRSDDVLVAAGVSMSLLLATPG
jgi:acyl-coenzyme A thioesterase PaaI-like protein